MQNSFIRSYSINKEEIVFNISRAWPFADTADNFNHRPSPDKCADSGKNTVFRDY